jgi:L-histidine N-alpha-methyltransferase
LTSLAAAPGLREPSVADAIRTGLAQAPRRLPFECFYDDLGSALFVAITELPEYGLSRAERRLLTDRRGEIAELLPSPLEVVELGSGSGRTTRRLLEALVDRGPVRYHPVDISAAALEECRREMFDVRGLTVAPFEGSHLEGLEASMARRRPGATVLALFLGSNLGNFDRDLAQDFLREIRKRLRPGDGLLLGADLVKPEPMLLAAYDDPAGVSAAFNRNALARINRELEGDFDVAAFAHRAVYDPLERRVEMHLSSPRAQHVRVKGLGLEFTLAPGETIWTESSHKFLPGELPHMGEEAGFSSLAEWTDDEWPFALSLLVAQ